MINLENIKKIAADLMTCIVKNSINTENRWLEIYSAIYTVLIIQENSPVIDLFTINPTQLQQAQLIGNQIGKCEVSQVERSLNIYKQ